MRRICLSGPVFLFMKREEKLTFKATWHDPGDVYFLWPRGEFWDVRYRKVKHGQLEWKPIADKPFANEDEASQAAYSHSVFHI